MGLLTGLKRMVNGPSIEEQEAKIKALEEEAQKLELEANTLKRVKEAEKKLEDTKNKVKGLKYSDPLKFLR